MAVNQIKYQRALAVFILVLFCFLTLMALLVSYQQRKLLYAVTDYEAGHYLDLMADASVEALIKSDYVTVKTLVMRWGEAHHEIHSVRVEVPNGYVLAAYRNPVSPAVETYSRSKDVVIGRTMLATIHLVGDYSDAEKIASKLRKSLILGGGLITMLFGISLWHIFKKMALAPLEKMVDERTLDLLVANQELEQEIAERIKAEKALREREEHITLILNSISEGIFGVDLKGNCTFCNPAALRLLGYERTEDVIGRKIHKLIHHTRPDGTHYHARDCKIYDSFRAGKGIHSDDEVFWRSDGTNFPVEYWAQPVIQDSSPIGAVTVFTDITERKHTEESLRDQEEELSAIFRNAPYCMILLDQDRKLVRGNSAAFERPGKSATELVGSLVGEVLRCINSLNEPAGCGFGLNCPNCLLRNTIIDTMEKGRNFCQRETKLKINDGGHDREITVLLSTARLSIRNQHMVLLSMLDITETRRLEAQLLQSQKMESIGTLAGGIAHDFNNILNVIVGYGHLTLMKMAHDDPNRLNVRQMLEASERATHLTKDLLLFSRKQQSARKSVDLNEIIQKLEKFLVRVIGEDIAIRTTRSGGRLTINADEHQVEQVLMNLATNARDAMTKGGILAVNTEQIMLDDASAAVHGLDKSGNFAVITVSDTGKGMDKETSEHIFEPFYTTKEAGKGTGLGLAVVYGIIKQHEGYINVYSEPEMGTTFRIYLPVISAGAAAEKAPVAEEHPVAGTETILFAEDNETVRKMTVTVLKDFGYTVIAAVDGEDAVNKYLKNKDAIQLLLFDLIMPRKSGKEAYDEIRKIRPDIKTIFASGYSPDIVRDKASLEGDLTIVYKPISPADLLKKVRSVLDEGNP